MTFYEINQQLSRLLELPDGEAVDTETGEVFSPEAIEGLNIALDEKIEGCGVFCKSCEAEIIARKAEIETQRREIARLERQIARTTDLVKMFGGVSKDRPFKSTKVTWTWKKNPAHVEISPGLTYRDFSAEWLRVKDPEIDKSKIKEALKAGAVIDGAALVSDESLRFK